MITTGLSLALLTSAGFYLLFVKMPKKIRRFMQKHVLFTDTVACLLTYILFGSTLIALFAAAWLGIIVSCILAITSNPALNGILERFLDKIGELKDVFVDWVTAQVNKDKPELKVA